MDAYPLTWPTGQPRQRADARAEGRFHVSFAAARDDLLREVALLGGMDVVISSNVPTRRDGLPYADYREPLDPAVAVYFTRRVSNVRRPFVVACDQYRKVAANIRGIGLTIEAMRSIQRYGSSALLEQAFTGFAALPAASNGAKAWWQVLGVLASANMGTIRAAYIALCSANHPDVGGEHAHMVAINAAFEQAQRERGTASP